MAGASRQIAEPSKQHLMHLKHLFRNQILLAKMAKKWSNLWINKLHNDKNVKILT